MEKNNKVVISHETYGGKSRNDKMSMNTEYEIELGRYSEHNADTESRVYPSTVK